MSAVYQSSDGPEAPSQHVGPPVPKAHQACLTCRKQKRKCDKALPSCSLCTRMARQCDYSDPTPAPSHEDFRNLQLKFFELESKLNSGASHHPPYYSSPPTGSAGVPDQQNLDPQNAFLQASTEFNWMGVRNRFPPIAFLDSDAFEKGGVKVPAPSVEVPSDVLRILEDADRLKAAVAEYLTTVHLWLPIISMPKLDHFLSRTLWEIPSDAIILFLAMKLLMSPPADGLEITQNPIYHTTKRYLSLLEAAGTASLSVLQAGILLAWYEYGQAIYPAAYMSAGWCVRYGNLLGVNGHPEAPQLLPPALSWTEQEERARTWWSVLILDRLVSMGGQGYILSGQEPAQTASLPADDQAWNQGEPTQTSVTLVSSPIEEYVSSFSRLCQSSLMIGKVMAHHHGPPIAVEDERFQLASKLYIEISFLANKLTEESQNSDFLTLSPALALTFTALCKLCDRYSRLDKTSGISETALSSAAVTMQSQAIDGIKTVSQSIVEYSQKLEEATSTPHDFGRVSPIIMDALYAAAANYAWLVRENGDESSQQALDGLRQCLRNLGTRWRSAAEYLRILEAQEVSEAQSYSGWHSHQPPYQHHMNQHDYAVYLHGRRS